MEPAIAEHQDEAYTESQTFVEVDFAHDPIFRHDWLSYFRFFVGLSSAFELWERGVFLRNVETRPTRLHKSVECIPVWSFFKSHLSDFECAAKGTKSPAGVVAVFRSGPPDAEPFGVWFFWLHLQGHVIIVDLQNAAVHSNLSDAIASLAWSEPARLEEVFYAPIRKERTPHAQ